MANTQRLSISLGTESADKVRKLVASGRYPSISAAMETAAQALFEHEAEVETWWAETIRRAIDAHDHPERLVDADTFFDQLHGEIAARKQRRPTK